MDQFVCFCICKYGKKKKRNWQSTLWRARVEGNSRVPDRLAVRDPHVACYIITRTVMGWQSEKRGLKEQTVTQVQTNATAARSRDGSCDRQVLGCRGVRDANKSGFPVVKNLDACFLALLFTSGFSCVSCWLPAGGHKQQQHQPRFTLTHAHSSVCGRKHVPPAVKLNRMQVIQIHSREWMMMLTRVRERKKKEEEN
jgi:hypothetical protein